MQCNPSYWELPGLQASSVCTASLTGATDLGCEHSSWATPHQSSSSHRARWAPLLLRFLACLFLRNSLLFLPTAPPPISCLPGDLLEANWASLDLSSSLPMKQVPVWIKDLALANTVSYVRQPAATHILQEYGGMVERDGEICGRIRTEMRVTNAIFWH